MTRVHANFPFLNIWDIPANVPFSTKWFSTLTLPQALIMCVFSLCCRTGSLVFHHEGEIGWLQSSGVGEEEQCPACLRFVFRNSPITFLAPLVPRPLCEEQIVHICPAVSLTTVYGLVLGGVFSFRSWSILGAGESECGPVWGIRLPLGEGRSWRIG